MSVPNRGAFRAQIHEGDALERLQQLPEACVDCVVTSPPYFRLRNYGHDQQIGLEDGVEHWVSRLRAVSAQVARVLVPTGTFWLNLGDTYSAHPREGAARKSLLGAPERLLLALINDGWLLRNKIVWFKPNTIPSSVADRLSTRYEVIYLLARRPRYYFDLDAIRQPHISTARPRRADRRGDQRPDWLGPNSDGDQGLAAMHRAGVVGHPLGKNPGDVWPLAVSRYRGAHFATYPVELVERMLRAGCPEARCRRCDAPHRRAVQRLGHTATRLALAPTCECQAESEPGLVLDPFMGSGTTAIAAERLGYDWSGIELNPEFIELARERIDAQRARDGPQRPAA